MMDQNSGSGDKQLVTSMDKARGLAAVLKKQQGEIGYALVHA